MRRLQYTGCGQVTWTEKTTGTEFYPFCSDCSNKYVDLTTLAYVPWACMGRRNLDTYSAATPQVQDKVNMQSVSSSATVQAMQIPSRSLSYALLFSSGSVCCLMYYGRLATTTSWSLTAEKALRLRNSSAWSPAWLPSNNSEGNHTSVLYHTSSLNQDASHVRVMPSTCFQGEWSLHRNTAAIVLSIKRGTRQPKPFTYISPNRSPGLAFFCKTCSKDKHSWGLDPDPSIHRA